MLSRGGHALRPTEVQDPLATVWEGYQAPAEVLDAADWLLERGECSKLWGPAAHPPLGGRIGARKGPSGAAGHAGRSAPRAPGSATQRSTCSLKTPTPTPNRPLSSRRPDARLHAAACGLPRRHRRRPRALGAAAHT